MSVSLYSGSGRLRSTLIEGMDRREITDQAMPGDTLTVCGCDVLPVHFDAASGERRPHRVMTVRFDQGGPVVEHGPRWKD